MSPPFSQNLKILFFNFRFRGGFQPDARMVKKREHKVDFDKRKNVPEELATKKEDIFEEYDRAIQVS